MKTSLLLSIILGILIALLIQFTLFFFYYYNNKVEQDYKIDYVFGLLTNTGVTTITYEKDN